MKENECFEGFYLLPKSSEQDYKKQVLNHQVSSFSRSPSKLEWWSKKMSKIEVSFGSKKEEDETEIFLVKIGEGMAGQGRWKIGTFLANWEVKCKANEEERKGMKCLVNFSFT